MQTIDFWISIDHRSPGDKERDSMALCYDGLREAGLMSPSLRVHYEKDQAELEQALVDIEKGGSVDPWEIVQEWENIVDNLSKGELIAFYNEGDFHVCDSATYQEKYREFTEF